MAEFISKTHSLVDNDVIQRDPSLPPLANAAEAVSEDKAVLTVSTSELIINLITNNKIEHLHVLIYIYISF